MTMMRSALAIGLGLGLLAGCGGSSSSGGGGGGQSFDGTWVACRNDGLNDFRESVTVTGTAADIEIIDYATTDVTCDGDGTSEGVLPATVAFGSRVSVPFHSSTVQATQADLTIGTDTFYSLAYRDEVASPDALYLGDDSGALDGSTPALRPTTLQETLPRALQTDPVNADLTGTWALCPVAEGQVLVIDAVAGTFDLKTYSGTCGAGTITNELSGTFTFAAPVYAGWGGVTVTAFAVDLSATGGGSLYTTVYVDTSVSPHWLFHGDDSLHGMDGSSPDLRPRVLSGELFVKQ